MLAGVRTASSGTTHATLLASCAMQVACVPGWVEQLSTIRLNGVGFLQINASEERTDEAAVLRGSLALLRALPCNKQ